MILLKRQTRTLKDMVNIHVQVDTSVLMLLSCKRFTMLECYTLLTVLNFGDQS